MKKVKTSTLESLIKDALNHNDLILRKKKNTVKNLGKHPTLLIAEFILDKLKS